MKNSILSAGFVLAGTAAAVSAQAQDMASSMTLVSWGGAYQISQINAYSDPYAAMHEGLEVIWEESSYEAVARIRGMKRGRQRDLGSRGRGRFGCHPPLR